MNVVFEGSRLRTFRFAKENGKVLLEVASAIPFPEGSELTKHTFIGVEGEWAVLTVSSPLNVIQQMVRGNYFALPLREGVTLLSLQEAKEALLTAPPSVVTTERLELVSTLLAQSVIPVS